MSCAVVSVNRALGVLAVVWMLMPVGQATTDTKTEPVAPSSLQLAAHASREEFAPPYAPAPVEPGKLDEAQAMLPPLGLAITQPNRKKARVTNGK
jgi:hypothetical protein